MKVDIIMPTYNHKGYIEQAINSCLSQTYKNIKLTIIDDYSTNDIGHLIKKYPNANFIKTPKNMGPAGARNFGIKNTNGDLISFLDDDDIMCPDKIRLSVDEFIKNPNIGMTCGNYRILVNGRLKRPFYNHPIKINHKNLMRQNLVASGSTTVKRSAFEEIGGFDQEYWIGEDYSAWLTLSEKFKIIYIDKVLYFYRIIPGGGSLTQRADIQEKHIENLKKIKDASRGRLIDAARKSKENTDKDLSS